MPPGALDLYRRPADLFVASFLGEANLLPVTLEGGRPVTALGPLDLPAAEGQQLLVRPEDLAVAADGVPATIAEVRGLGPYDRVILRLPGGVEVLAHLASGTAPTAGAGLCVALRPGAGHLL